MKKMYLFSAFLFFVNFISAQTTFIKKVAPGGDENDLNTGIVTKDNNYLFGGAVFSSNGDTKALLTKLDVNGNVVWQKYLDNFEELNSVAETNDGNYIVAGDNYQDKTQYDCSITKIDKNGTVLWSKALGGSDNEGILSVTPTADGGYAFCGIYFVDEDSPEYGYIGKLDANGNKLWTKILNPQETLEPRNIIETSDKNLIVVGNTGLLDFDVNGLYIAKFDESGNRLFEKQIAGDADSSHGAAGVKVIETPDKGYLISGAYDIRNSSTDVDACIIKIDTAGNLIWGKTYGTTTDGESASLIASTSDGNYVALSGDFSQDSSYILFKVDGNGNLITSREVLGPESVYSEDVSFISGTSDNGIFMGSSGVDFITAKLDENLNSCGKSNNANVSITGDITQIKNYASTITDGLDAITPLTVTTSAFSNLTDVCTVLPLNLIAFNVVNKASDNILSWRTSQEINTSYFNIQRSDDGVHFVTIGKIYAAGNSNNIKNYTYTDANITSLRVSKIYYRLQEVDKDGTNFFTNIQTIILSAAHSLFSVSPNPTKDFIDIFSSNNIANTQVKITDMSGRTLFVTKQNFSTGQKLRIALSKFPSEVLFVTIVTNTNREQFKITKE